MVGAGMFDGVFEGILIAGIIIALSLWGCWELIDYLFIDEAIKVSAPITPELEIFVKDNVVDTLYIYREPK